MVKVDERFFTRRYASHERVVTKVLPWSDERAYIELPAVLRVFEMLDGPDTVVAFDADDAWSVWELYCGESRKDYEEDEWIECAGSRPMRIWLDEDFSRCDCRAKQEARRAETDRAVALLSKLPRPAAGALWAGVPKPLPSHPNGHLMDCPVGSKTQTCAQWAQENGRGFLCSTEY
jgi:hypothetical protein